jgi:hypothetical protein
MGLVELRTGLERFERELRDAGLKETTIHTYVERSARFLNWLASDYQTGVGAKSKWADWQDDVGARGPVVSARRTRDASRPFASRGLGAAVSGGGAQLAPGLEHVAAGGDLRAYEG